MSTPRLYWVGPDGQESVFLIASSEVLIGRKGDADVVLSNQHVSRHHAKIVMMPEGYFLQDLGSTHGTFVNDQLIEQHILKDGDRIALGKDRVELQYLVTDDLSTRAPAKADTTRIFEKSLMNLGVVLPPEYSDLEKISCLLDFQYQWEQLFTPNAAFQKILEFALKISGAERGFILVREGTAFGYAAGLDGMGRTLTPSHFQTSQTVVNDVVAKGSPVFMVEGLDKKYIEQAKKLEQELALAEETQRSLLPQTLPKIENLSIHAFSKPTRYVGGDFYDFLQMELRAGLRVDEAVNRLNRFLCEKSSSGRFVTMFLLTVSSEGRGKYISAGHNPSYLFRAAKQEIEELGSNNMIVGAFSYASYQPDSLQLEKGDVLVVYSDGLTEAENPHGEMLGEERVKDVIRQEAPSGSKQLEQKLLETIQRFTGGRSQTDDITLMIIERV